MNTTGIPHYDQSGNSPPTDRQVTQHNPAPSRLSHIPCAIPRETKRAQRIYPLIEATARALDACFEQRPFPIPFMPLAVCRECRAQRRLTLFRSDSFERIPHQPRCRVGRAFASAARVSRFDLPSRAAVVRALRELNTISVAFRREGVGEPAKLSEALGVSR